MLKKNTAVTGFPIGLFINSTTGAVVTTGTPTCKRILDGTGGACANAASYNSDAGQWEIDLDAADTNGAMVGLSFTLTDCLPITYRFRTVTVDLNDSVRGGMTALPNAAAGANGGLPLGDANARVSVGSWLDQAVTVSVGNKPQVDAYSISGDSVAADNFETMLDGTGGKTLSLGCLSVVYPGGEGYAVEIMNEYGTGTFFGNGIHVHGTVKFYGDEGGKAIDFFGRNVAFSVPSAEGDPCGFVTNDEYLGAYRQLHLLEQSDSGDTILARASDATDAVTAIEAYGDTKWLTATAFATQGDITGLAQYGDLNWTTATGFATPTNVTDAVTAIESHGDTNWGTADVSALATSAELAIVEGKVDDVLEETGVTLPGLIDGITSAVRDAILDRVLSGNHDETGSTGKLLQDSAAKLAGATGTLANTNNAATFKADVSALATSDELAATDAKVDSVLEDTGTTLPAAITGVWEAEERTLTSSASTVGPTAGTTVSDIFVTVYDSQTARLDARIRNWDGDDILQADITSITYTISLLDAYNPDTRTAVDGHTAVTLNKASVIYDTLQSDSWASDYNFSFIPDISTKPAFALSGRQYVVDVNVTPTTGQRLPGPRFIVTVK